MKIMTGWGDSYGNKIAPLEILGSGSMIPVGPAFFRVAPGRAG